MDQTTASLAEGAPPRSALARVVGALRRLAGSVLPVFGLVLRHALVGMFVMVVAAGLLSMLLPEAGLLATLGRWTILVTYAVVGLAGGLLLGLNVAATRGVGAFQEQVRLALSRLTPAEAERLVPRVPLSEARAGYERALDSVVDRAVLGVRLPRPIRALLRYRMRQDVIEAFLAECEERGAESVGFGELRDWLVSVGMPLVTAPARTQLRTTRVLLLGAGATLVAVTVILAMPALWPAILAALPTTLAILGVLTVALGLPGATAYERPWRRRLGVVVIGASLALWPVIWMRLAEADLGLVWLLVLTATIGTLSYGSRMAVVEANRPKILP